MEKVLEKSKFLISLGVQIKSNIELQRLRDKALRDLTIAVVNYELGLSTPFAMTEEEKSRALFLSKIFCIQDICAKDIL